MPAPEPAPVPNVPVGTSTIAGYSVTAGAVLLALLAFVGGDHSQQTLGTLAGAGLAALAFIVTQAGRYAQAHALAKGGAGADVERALVESIIDAAEAAGRAAALRAVQPQATATLMADTRDRDLPSDEDEEDAPPPADAEADDVEPPVPDVEVSDHHLAAHAAGEATRRRSGPPAQPSQSGLIDPAEVDAPPEGDR